MHFSRYKPWSPAQNSLTFPKWSNYDCLKNFANPLFFHNSLCTEWKSAWNNIWALFSRAWKCSFFNAVEWVRVLHSKDRSYFVFRLQSSIPDSMDSVSLLNRHCCIHYSCRERFQRKHLLERVAIYSCHISRLLLNSPSVWKDWWEE